MKRLSCKKVEARLGDYFEGQISELDNDAITVHLAVCDRCRELSEIWSGLGVAVREAELPPLSGAQEKQLVAARELPFGLESPVAGRAMPLAVAAAVLLIGTGIGLYFWPFGTVLEPVQGMAAYRAQPADDSATFNDYLFMPDRPGRRVIEVVPGTALWLGDDAAVTVELVTSREARFRLTRGYVLAEIGVLEPGYRFVVETPRGEVEARGTVFSVDVSSAGKARVRVIEGLVEVRKTNTAGNIVLLSEGQERERDRAAPSMAASADIARDLAFLYGIDEKTHCQGTCGPDVIEREDAVTKPTVAHKSSGTTPERAFETAVAVSSKAPVDSRADAAILAIREGRLAAAAELIQEEARTNPRSEKTIEILVKLAQAHRRAKAFRDASDVYHQLIESYPGSRAAANSLVALGQMELSIMNRAEDALSHFTSYLSGSPAGVLAEEARAGRVRALSRLVRHREVIVAAAEYFWAHPRGSAAAEMLRRRADAHKREGDCKQAAQYYREVLRLWPNSKEARNAQAGLAGCKGSD